jgi:hypothetical protein
MVMGHSSPGLPQSEIGHVKGCGRVALHTMNWSLAVAFAQEASERETEIPGAPAFCTSISSIMAPYCGYSGSHDAG